MKKTMILAVLAMASVAFAQAPARIVMEDIVVDISGGAVDTKMDVVIEAIGANYLIGNGFSIYITDLSAGGYPHPGLVTGIEWLPTDPFFEQNDDTEEFRPLFVAGVVSQDGSNGDLHGKTTRLYIHVPADWPLGTYIVRGWIDEDIAGGRTDSYYNTMAGGTYYFDTTDLGYITVIPEPVSALLLGLGGLFLRRRR